MSIFLVTPLANNADALADAIARTCDDSDVYTLMNKAGWLIDFEGTTVEMSAFIGITGSAVAGAPKLGSALVTPVTTYYGRGPTDMWEWLKSRFEKQ